MRSEYSFAVGDFNADGRDDLIQCDAGGCFLYHATGTESAPFALQTTVGGGGAFANVEKTYWAPANCFMGTDPSSRDDAWKIDVGGAYWYRSDGAGNLVHQAFADRTDLSEGRSSLTREPISQQPSSVSSVSSKNEMAP